MNSKSLLIAIAALALTASGAQAFTGSALSTAGLTDEQQAAFETARELREEGDVTKARDVLVKAGIDEATLRKVRTAMHNERHAEHEAMESALSANDFTAFTVAIADSPLQDLITNEDDFQSFKEAHDLMESGDAAGAKEIFDNLGIPEPKKEYSHKGHGTYGQSSFFSQLTDTQKEAFNVARQANDRDAMDAILDEAGVVKPTKGDTPKFLKDGREIH